MSSSPDDLDGWVLAAAPARPIEPSHGMRVVIVSDNDETLDGLEEYLRQAGIAARGTRQLLGRYFDDARVDAAILFPDDFGRLEVIERLQRLARDGERPLCVLVTRDARGFESLLASQGIPRVIVIAKPAWGWTILDALRTRLEP